MAYWQAALDDGDVTRLDVAAGFASSSEARTSRAVRLHERLLGLAPTPAVTAVLADQLQSVDERVLAAQIAASPEAYRRWSGVGS